MLLIVYNVLLLFLSLLLFHYLCYYIVTRISLRLINVPFAVHLTLQSSKEQGSKAEIGTVLNSTGDVKNQAFSLGRSRLNILSYWSAWDTKHLKLV